MSMTTKRTAPAPLAQDVLGEFLPLQVECRDHRAPGPRTPHLLLEQLVAELVEKQLLHPVLAHQARVVEFLKSRPALGFLPQRFVKLDRPGGQTPDAAGVADDVRRALAMRVMAAVHRMQLDARRQLRLDATCFLLVDLTADEQW